MNAGLFIVNMVTQPDSKLRSLTDAEFEALGRKYFNNQEWLRGSVRFWLERSR